MSEMVFNYIQNKNGTAIRIKANGSMPEMAEAIVTLIRKLYTETRPEHREMFKDIIRMNVNDNPATFSPLQGMTIDSREMRRQVEEQR